MKANTISYLPNSYSRKAIVLFIIALALCTLFFKNNALPWLWISFASIEVLGFFLFTSQLSKKWRGISTIKFRQKIFWTALILRVIWVVFSYYFFIAQTGEPFDFVMGDSYSYHTWARIASNTFSEKGFGQFFESRLGYSDLGYPMFLTVIYLIFGDSIIIARLIFALLGAWTCVLVYNIAKRNFDEQTARISAIMAMILPNLIYYTGLHLKESVMVFLVVLFVDRTEILLRSINIKFMDVILVALIAGILFFFRTVLGAAALFSLFSGLVFSDARMGNWFKRILVGSWIIILI